MAEIGLDGRAGTPARAARLRPRIAADTTRAALLSMSEAAAIAGDWAELGERAAEDNHFFSPDAVLAAAAHFGVAVRVAVVRDADGSLIAAAPVTLTRLGHVASAIRVWSHDYGPLGVPLVDAGRIDRGVRGLLDQVVPAGTCLVIPDLPLDGPVAAAIRRAAAVDGRPVAAVGAQERAILDRVDGADLRAGLPGRRRKEFARQMRRLADLGTVTLESVTDADAAMSRLEEFMALEASGWKGRGHTALVSSPSTAAFARAVVQARAAHGAVRIDALRLDGRPLAMLVSFTAGRTAWTWKIAYAEAYARFSPGAQIMLEVARNLFADGRVQRIDSCAAAHHPMIDHLWKGRLAIGTLVVGPSGGGVAYGLGLGILRAETGARDLARRLRGRLQPHRHKEHSA